MVLNFKGFIRETLKELKCDSSEFYRKDISGYVNRKPVKVILSKDNT